MTDELGFAAAEAMGLVEVGPAPKSAEERLEEIRCLEREIWIVGEMLQVFSHAAEQAIKAPPGYCHADLVRNSARNCATIHGIIATLTAAHDELKQGMK